MSTDNSSYNLNSNCSKLFQPKNRLIIMIILCMIIISLIVTTITFGVLWSRSKSNLITNSIYAVGNGTIGFPIRLPNDGKYVQWTILQLNDVYEILPLDQGRKGGLARVDHLRQLLLEENAQTLTILSGDFVSPSALSQSIVNGTKLNGKQMISSLNTLGLDLVTFGNHEFDLTETELISRMNESTFTWIGSNVFQSGRNESFSTSVPYKLINIDNVEIVFIGLTIEIVKPYISIISRTSLIPFVKKFVQSLSNLRYDVLIALTHLDLETDIQLAENIPQIDLILGGHEHEDYFLSRGSEYIPISKADSNAFTVYIHRCAFNLDTKQFRVYHRLSPVTSEFEEEQKTGDVVNYWYNLGIKGFEQKGFRPNETVSCLPDDVQLDGRSTSIRNFATVLTDDACNSFLQSTSENGTTIAIYNTGSIRNDDILRGKITQYDILRVFPFEDELVSLSIPGSYLANILSNSLSVKGSGEFLAYCGIDTQDQGKTWFTNGSDISKSGLNYNIATITYLENNLFKNTTVSILKQFNITQSQSLINYLQNKYPSC